MKKAWKSTNKRTYLQEKLVNIVSRNFEINEFSAQEIWEDNALLEKEKKNT